MAIYRPPKPRWPLGLFGALFGIGIGIIATLLMAGEPDPTEIALDLKSELNAAAGSLEVAGIEYDESVAGGEVVNETEHRGAQSALASSRARFEAAREALAVLAPDLVESLVSGYDRAEQLMEDVADPAEVEAALGDLARELRITGG